MTSSLAARRAAPALVALLALAPVGCGPSVGSVTGTVTLNGAPVGDATVSFIAPDGTIRSCQTGPDGAYRAEDVPAGPVQVTVQPATGLDAAAQEIVKNTGNAPPPKANDKKLALAERYADGSTSGLATTVKSGENKYDLELTP